MSEYESSNQFACGLLLHIHQCYTIRALLSLKDAPPEKHSNHQFHMEGHFKDIVLKMQHFQSHMLDLKLQCYIYIIIIYQTYHTSE